MDINRLGAIKAGLAEKTAQASSAQARKEAEAKARQEKIEAIEFAFGDQQQRFRSAADRLAGEVSVHGYVIDHDVAMRPDPQTFGTYYATLSQAGGQRPAIRLMAHFTGDGVVSVSISRPHGQILDGGHFHAEDLGKEFWEEWLLRLAEVEIAR